MRIEYSYNKYNDSKKATEISHVLNMILAMFYPLIGIGNLLAILGIGGVTYEMLNANKGFDWTALIIFFIVYIANIIFLLIKLCIDIICEQIVLSEKNKDLSISERKMILKNNRIIKLRTFFVIAKITLIYLPLIAIGIAFIAALIYAIKNVDILILLISLLVLSIDVFTCIFVKKRLIN